MRFTPRPTARTTPARLSPLSLALAALFALPLSSQAQTNSAAPAQPAASAEESSAAKAATAEATGGTNKLEAVKVTARRREETLRDVPVAVTALSATALEALNVKNLGDLQGQVPNLTVYAARGSNSTITTFIRGVGQADPLWGVDPGVGIYLDDVYMARPQGALLEVFDVQRIEVLRGPQGTLYGKNTIGGAIKYVSRPLGTATEGSLSFSTGNYGQANFKGSVGGSTADGQIRARFAVASLNREGYGKNLTDGSDVSNQDTTAARATVGYFAKDMPLTVVFSADRALDDSNMRGFKRLNANPPVESNYDIATGMANKNSTDTRGHSLTATLNLSNAWTAKFVHANRRGLTNTGIDFDGLPAKTADVLARYADKQTSNELQFSYDSGSGHAGVLGLYQFDGEAGGTVLNNFFNLLFGSTNGTVYTKGKAVYGDWSWRLSPSFSLSTGLRYTKESKHARVLNQGFKDATFSQVTGVTADFDKTREVSNTAPKLSLDYKLSGTTNLYASASRGFKSGGYNVRAQAVAVPRSAEPFNDETLDSLELGAKTVLDGGRLEINSAVFHNKYKNVQLSIFTSYIAANGTPSFFGDFTNAGKATVQGAEVEFAWRPDSAWSLSGNVAYVNAKYDEYIDRGVNVAADKKFSNTPKFQGALNIEYRTGVPLGGVLKTRLGLNYRTKVYPTTDLSEVIAQNAYGLISAGLIWEKTERLSFSLQGSNLANKAYRTDGYNIPSLTVLSGFYGAPRTFTAGVGYKF
ncbi:TonB-dependent receptor [Paucibacter aquatile]|uniref:TonB-dependent receptor n=1 Tax=Kinneretia aquatilis TaxID=2070761 RepID=A0A2N8KZV7_9BURK|nr:TonB-dependent receptor [Paucibacter aquatile]PND38990.1 TonB-dependent receptor [Paucibacter aquatile]